MKGKEFKELAAKLLDKDNIEVEIFEGDDIYHPKYAKIVDIDIEDGVIVTRIIEKNITID